MAKERYLVSDLDESTRQYLTSVRSSAGQNMAGIFMSSGYPIATWGLPLLGAGIVILVLYFVIPPLNHPTHQAMLLTAGLLMGGWMLVAGIRVVMAIGSGHNLGVFTYADPQQIWVVDNSVVERYPLDKLQSATVEGQTLVLEYPDGQVQVPVPFEVGILEIAAYVEYWLSVRGDGPINQALIETHAAIARAVAYDQTPDSQPSFSLDIPAPHRSETPRSRSADWPILAGIAVGGVALFFVVHAIVLVWHDNAVFDAVRHQSPTHWRAYLVDERNTRHREEIQTMLRGRYQQKAEELKAQILAKTEPAFKGSDEAMTLLLLALSEAPQAVVTLRVQDTTDEKTRAKFPGLPNADALQSRAQMEMTDSLYSAIGQDLISLVQPLDEVPAWLDIRFKFAVQDNKHRIEWTLAVRKDPDAEPVYQSAWTTDVLQQPGQAEEVFVKDLGRIKNALGGSGP